MMSTVSAFSSDICQSENDFLYSNYSLYMQSDC